MTKDEALKLALDALDVVKLHYTQNRHVNEAITAVKEALAQPEQEPVAHQYQSKDGVWRDFISQSHYKATVEDGSWPIRALYTFPPAQRTWVSLTDEQVIKTFNAICNGKPFNVERILELHSALEVELRSKNT